MTYLSIEHYYVVIVGSGPAGLGVANIIKENDKLAQRTLVLEKGPSLDERICPVQLTRTCRSCDPCNIVAGVGGAGPYTDGKICLFPQRLPELIPSWKEDGDNKEIDKKIAEYLDRVKIIWMDYGAKDFIDIKSDSPPTLQGPGTTRRHQVAHPRRLGLRPRFWPYDRNRKK